MRGYEGLLRERAVPLGIIARSDASRVRERHIEDSLRVLGCLGDARTVVDVGSGAGLPGIPVAIARPDVAVVLVEPRRARSAFLEFCAETLGLANVRVEPRAAAEVDMVADLGLTRALADAPASWRLASPLVRKGGAVVYFAGRSWTDGDVALLERDGVSARICAPASFSWQGPLVTMSRMADHLDELRARPR